MNSKKPPVYAYFYPLTTSCPERNARAHTYGFDITDETQLCNEAQPLYEGHVQPVHYCLGKIALKNWDDTNPKTMQTQIDIARDHGVNGFIFDTYIGNKQGRKIHEMKNVLDDTFLKADIQGFKFANMAVLGSPRVALPVPKTKYFEEENRYYDRTKGTVRSIIDHFALNYWQRENYIRMKRDDRPYMSVFASDMRNDKDNNNEELTLPDMIEYMKEYSLRKYKIEPYLVSVCLKACSATPLIKRGADAMTGYAFLPDFGFEADPVQDYKTQIDKRAADWQMISKQLNKPYVPPVVVGWDASPRGSNGVDLNSVSGIYPYTPIVENSSSKEFGRMLKLQSDFVTNTVPEAERYTPITAWNEITEGASLLPKISMNGSIDTSYLEAVRTHQKGHQCSQ